MFLTALPVSARVAAESLSECEARFEVEQTRDAAYCFFAVVNDGLEPWDRAARSVSAALERHPDDPWLHFYLGHLIFLRAPEQTESAYRKAIDLFAARDEAAEEIEARIALVRLLSRDQRFEEAERVLEEAFRTATATGDPLLLASVQIRQAIQNHYRFRDLHHSYNRLLSIRDEVFSRGSESLVRQWLEAAFFLSSDLGRHDATRAHLRDRLAQAERLGNRNLEAEVRLELAALHLNSQLPSPGARRKARELLEAAHAAARAANHPWFEARALLELGKLIGGEAGRARLEKSLELANGLGDPRLTTSCRGALAENLLDEDPAGARELVERSLPEQAPDPWFAIYGWEERASVDWATLPRPRAITRSIELLDWIESLRELQGSEAGRAGLISFWSNPYYWVSGRLLHPDAAATREDLELAFRVIERMRAQVLLQALMNARATAARPETDAGRRLTEIMRQKVETQRRLLDPRLDPAARSEVVAELRALETREAEARHLIAGDSPAEAPLHQATLASLREVEERLGEDEALLSFQLGLDEDFFGRFAGGAWLLVVTRDGTRVHRLPDRVEVEPALDVLLGLDPDDATAGLARLHDTLLAPALAELPSGVDRLVIVPDGKLHRLPFGLLRPSDGEPLIQRYRITLAPSATLWRRWRDLGPPTSEVPALAMAAPALAGQDEAPTGEAAARQWALERGARLPPLPFAREEGRAVVRTLGGGSRLLLGEEASERFLKEDDLRRYGVIHFATHAVIDDEVPERSAVLLAPGAADEDGWLQPQDIVELDLEGRVVVLASCDSAAGQVLRGEGPMSLARAFFQARSPVVVASLEPLPDDQSARLFKEFYRSLARGASVDEALAVAQRERARQGAPARAWASLVVLGDGAVAPFPGGLARPGPPLWPFVALGVVGLVAAGLVLRQARRR